MNIDPEVELGRFGIPVDTLKRGGTFIPILSFMRLLEHTAVVAKCPDFGLRLARYQGEDNPGPLLVLMRHSATLEEALQTGSRHLFVLGPAYHFSIEPVNDDRRLVDLIVDISVPQLAQRIQTVEHSVGFIVQIIKLVCRAEVRPKLVLLPHARQGPLQSYTDILGCECHFNAPVAAIRIAAKDLSLVLPDRNSLLQQMALSFIENRFNAPERQLTDEMRMLVRRSLDVGPVSLIEIAKNMALHPKTLQRRLAAEGPVFAHILDAARQDRFLELIAQPAALSLTQLAMKIGYSEQATLTRSCKRWFGCTPTEMQRQLAVNKGI